MSNSNYQRPRRVHTTKIVWHCSATKPDWDGGAADIDTMHLKRGWKGGLGYHIVVRRGGKVELGEHLQNQGAHVKGHNGDTIGICLIGGVGDNGKPENNFTQEQWDAALQVRSFLELLYPGVENVGHRDLSPDLDGDGKINSWEFVKACPSFDVKTEFGILGGRKKKRGGVTVKRRDHDARPDKPGGPADGRRDQVA